MRCHKHAHELRLSHCFPPCIARCPQEVCVRDTRHLHRRLKAHEQASAGALFRLEVKEVLAFVCSNTSCNLVVWVSDLQWEGADFAQPPFTECAGLSVPYPVSLSAFCTVRAEGSEG